MIHKQRLSLSSEMELVFCSFFFMIVNMYYFKLKDKTKANAYLKGPAFDHVLFHLQG